jgi:trans-aconitate methyltransferase
MTQPWNPNAYAQHGAFVHSLAGDVVDLLNPRTGEHILDLGCGDGQLTARLGETGAILTGVDSSPEMVAAARARHVNAEQASAESLPFPNESFDAVFSNAVLHWVKDHNKMLSEVHRVLKPEGRFVAEFGGHGNIAAIRTAFIAVLERHGYGQREDNVNYYPTGHAYTVLLQKHGFTVLRMSLVPRPTPLGPGGMSEWLKTFRSGVIESLPKTKREKVVSETTELLARSLRDEKGNWTADYVRLRFIAIRQQPNHS